MLGMLGPKYVSAMGFAFLRTGAFAHVDLAVGLRRGLDVRLVP